MHIRGRVEGMALILALITAGLCVRGQDREHCFFPLTRGTYWVYRGSVGWFDEKKVHRASTDVSLKMTVNAVSRRDGITVASLKGFPSDLDWQTGAVKPGRWRLIENAQHQVFLHELGGEDRDLTMEALANSFSSYVQEDDLLFQWPLVKGRKFCDDEAKKREDGMYCWVVESASSEAVGPIRGLPETSVPVYVLAYRSNPDDTEMELSQGIGILSYQYHHHGSIADTNLKLAEFHKGEAR